MGSAGFEVSDDRVRSAARTIRCAVDDVQPHVTGLAPVTVASQHFGRSHTHHQADYARAVERLAAGATAMCASMAELAARLADAGQRYADTDARSATQHLAR